MPSAGSNKFKSIFSRLLKKDSGVIEVKVPATEFES
jgi:hypothetical protein